MVWKRSRKLGHLPAGPRVHCQNRGNVAVEFRLHHRTFPIDYSDPAHFDSVCQSTAFDNVVYVHFICQHIASNSRSLAPTIETNPGTAVFDETKETTTMDRASLLHLILQYLTNIV
jgi:hypothetical protein